MAKSDMQSLLDALDFITELRQHSQMQAQANNDPLSGAYLLPSKLSSLRQTQLKAAFRVIDYAQDSLRLKFLRRF
ncbi:hypothetical protein NFHSH190041_23770 [Shewanella sp. NFH-SH190041]|nr:hypothetical protein NFHSH190041_23770 [Shewanella sp. NFH-SH190041]